MKDFIYNIPTKIYFGKDQLGHLGEELAQYGKRVLLTYGGGSIKKTGLYDKAMAEMKKAGLEVFELSGIEPNPRIDSVRKGAEMCKEHKIDVLLAEDCYEIDFDRLPKRCAFSYFVDSMGVETINDKSTICKYQKADIIYKEILNIFSENNANISGVKFENNGARVIAFASAGGGVGSSTVSAAFCKYLAKRGQKVLYLNLEMLGETGLYFNADGQFDFSDVIYALKSRKTNLIMKLESCVKQDISGVYFFDACKIALDMEELKTEELQTLLTTLKNTGSYQYIVLDIDFTVDNRAIEMFKLVNDMVFVSDGSVVSNIKFDRAYNCLSVIEQQSDISMLNKIHIIYNRFSNKTSTEIDKDYLHVLGGIPHYEHATTEQIINQILTLDVFNELM